MKNIYVTPEFLVMKTVTVVLNESNTDINISVEDDAFDANDQ